MEEVSNRERLHIRNNQTHTQHRGDASNNILSIGLIAGVCGFVGLITITPHTLRAKARKMLHQTTLPKRQAFNNQQKTAPIAFSVCVCFVIFFLYYVRQGSRSNA